MSELTTKTSSAINQIETAPRTGFRWGRIAAWSGLVALLVVIGLALYMTQTDTVQKGKLAPNFILTTFSGDQIDSRSLKGKVVVINFWASWCKPCEQEAADLEAAWRFYEPRGDVVFLGVDYIDTEPQALAYLKKFDITYPNGPDLRTRISQAYRIVGVPETYVIDQEGYLVDKKIGPYNNLAEIKAMIDPLLDR